MESARSTDESCVVNSSSFDLGGPLCPPVDPLEHERPGAAGLGGLGD